MTINTQVADVGVNAEADALARLLDNGYVRIYSGTQPATPDTPLRGNTLLAELRFPAVSAPAASVGVITFNSISAVTALATGTASFFRCLESDGTTVVMDGNIDTPGFNMILE